MNINYIDLQFMFDSAMNPIKLSKKLTVEEGGKDGRPMCRKGKKVEEFCKDVELLRMKKKWTQEWFKHFWDMFFGGFKVNHLSEEQVGGIPHLNQGEGSTCTIFALANAVFCQLKTRNIIIKSEGLIGVLLNSIKAKHVRNGVFPIRFHKFQIYNQINEDGQYGNITLNVDKKNFDQDFHHVLPYDLDRIHPCKHHGRHCVLIDHLFPSINFYFKFEFNMTD